MKSVIEFLCISEDPGLIEIGECFKAKIPQSRYEYQKKGEASEKRKSKMKNRCSSLSVSVKDEDGEQYDDILLSMIKVYSECEEYFNAISHISEFSIAFFQEDDYPVSLGFSPEVLTALSSLKKPLIIDCYSVKNADEYFKKIR